MKNAALIAAAGLLLYAAWAYTQDEGAIEETAADLADLGENTAQFIDNITGGSLKLSSMASVTAADLTNSNVQALLRVIRQGEGTSTMNGYRTIFGGGLFDSYADHPRRIVKKNGYSSSAAGAYQFLTSTWDETARIMGLGDFTPASQDLAAVGLLAKRGALADAKAGRFDAAIAKIGKEWASMPGSPYGQPVITLAAARTTYASNGGTFA